MHQPSHPTSSRLLRGMLAMLVASLGTAFLGACKSDPPPPKPLKPASKAPAPASAASGPKYKDILAQ